MTWYSKVADDISNLPGFIEYYSDQLSIAKRDVLIHGRVEQNISALPGITEERFNQLQEIEAILRLMELQLRKIRTTHFKKYLEGYNRALSSRDAEKYVEGEPEVVDFESLINEVALIRNKWLGLIKGLEQKGYSLNNVVKLRCAGMEDISI